MSHGRTISAAAFAAVVLAFTGLIVFDPGSVGAPGGGVFSFLEVQPAPEAPVGASEPEPGGPASIDPGAILPLSDLSPDASRFLASRPPQWAAAAYLPGRGALYAENADQPFPLASLAKLPMMLALLHQAASEGRELEAFEFDLLRWSITVSDNESADELWLELDHGRDVEAFLSEAGLDGFALTEGGGWGDLTATAPALARLLGALVYGELLPPEMRAVALELLTTVSDDQRWGATAGFPDGPSDNVPVKNGWYPAIIGWRVTSAAATLDDRLEPLVIVVLTRNQAAFEDALDTIHGTARRIGVAVYGSEVELDPVDPGPDRPPTTILRFEPAADGLPVVTGDCVAPSLLAQREGAVRCEVAEGTLDPCFVPADRPAVAVCRAFPERDEGAFVVELSSSVEPAGASSRPRPWYIRLESGVACTRVLEDTFDEDGDRVTFRCDDRSIVIGPLQEGASWFAFHAADIFAEGRNEVITAAWW